MLLIAFRMISLYFEMFHFSQIDMNEKNVKIFFYLAFIDPKFVQEIIIVSTNSN